MDGQTLQNEMRKKQEDLEEALQASKNRGREWANAERDYRIISGQAFAIEADNGTQVTIRTSVVKGRKEVADAEYARNEALVMYNSAKEAINVYKKGIEVLRDEIKREYGDNL